MKYFLIILIIFTSACSNNHDNDVVYVLEKSNITRHWDKNKEEKQFVSVKNCNIVIFSKINGLLENNKISTALSDINIESIAISEDIHVSAVAITYNINDSNGNISLNKDGYPEFGSFFILNKKDAVNVKKKFIRVVQQCL